MARDNVFEFDFSDFNEYFKLLDNIARKDFKEAVASWLEASGFEFLSVVQDEIIRRRVVDTRLLLNSFQKGKDENIWETKDGGLTLIVGTNVEYAGYVNDGHWTCKKGEKSRWVPGEWNGNTFTYNPSAKTGMLLKQRYIDGAHFWEAGIRIFERMFRISVERKMEQWRNHYWRRGGR
ncbi:HK97 gp10 family phage protein [Anaerovorax sp. IOR16]|uniref:HK97 gp10 family phage protein n=1 Tax=Anaerovorax sp. IOR16 TaxID=2773458 RepID=UPI0019D248FB|nr:HK97 gp10 family phage protein [Anaerovorax sp. IOR16]